ncbi:M23 family metallopeptidase [Parasediminibacterium sp. JCM 36343]|uniref:M23 family metallopeptidase n=1 Tax=Parasediminibacterium sp. JCM 36343 TaxID=3374279 RepID=UPI00397B82C2
MKKIKYYYNTNTLRYEKLDVPFRVRMLRIFGFVAACLVTAFIIMSIAYRYFPSANEKRLMEQNKALKDNYTVLQDQVQQLQLQMAELENRDNTVYRAIFEATPIPDSVRVKKMEKSNEVKLVQGLSENILITGIKGQLDNLTTRVAFMDKSYAEIAGMVKNKEKLLSAIPAIQPVSNKDLSRIASGFGYRIDPVYKVRKFHAGLDFTAPQGTPIYSTADGTVKEAGFNNSGFGNHVIINHGYGYETLYGHMVKVKTRPGKTVKRGEVIGYVGSTGKSTGPHCHYEVHRNGIPIDPVYYFYNDINPAQFDRLLKQAASANQSFD